jgi:predicted nucleic acid-binding Zn ribbon protein
MPGVYKEKECPTCKKEHRKQGKFCSQSCSSIFNNAGQKKSPETKRKLSERSKEYRRTPEGIATTKVIARVTEKRHAGIQTLPEDEWIVEVPIENEDDDGFRL